MLSFRLSRLQVALFLSVGFHLFFILSFSSGLIPLSKHPTSVKDYHLPVSVELVQSAKPAAVKPTPVKAISKVQNRASNLKSQDSTSDVSASSPKPVTPKKSPEKTNRFNKNELVSFSKSYSPSSKSWNRAPVYPDSARRLGREGRVILEAHLNDLGKVISVQVARSSGSSDLDQAAIDAVREWTMDLPSDGSKRLFIPITFRFNSNS